MADLTKRIVFSNETANDQGGIIPNNVLDFSRYNENPVILAEHNWDGYGLKPFENIIGLATDIALFAGNYTMVPQFHGLTDTSKTAKQLYDQGYLRACSIGGEAHWQKVKNQMGNEEDYINPNGLRVCERFIVYEISMVALPSNPTAVQLAALQESKPTFKIYNTEESQKYNSSITTLNSHIQKLQNMKTEKTPDQLQEEITSLESKLATKETELETATVALASAKGDAAKKLEAETALSTVLSEKKEIETALATLKANNAKKNENETVLDKVIDLLKSVFGGKGMPEPLDKILDKKNAEFPLDKDGDAGDNRGPKPAAPKVPQPTPTGLKSKLEKSQKEAEAARDLADKATKEAEAAKVKLEDAEGDEMKASCQEAYDKAMKDAEKATKEAEDAEKAFNKVKQEVDDSEDTEAKAAKKAAEDAEETEKVKNASPKKRTIQELKSVGVKLAAKPQIKMSQSKFTGKTFSQLRAELKENPDKFGATEEGKMFHRVMTDQGEKQPGDYVFMLESILSDPRLNAKHRDPMGNLQPSVLENIRFHSNLTMGNFESYRKSVIGSSMQGGESLNMLLEKFKSGGATMPKKMTKLTTISGGTIQTPDTYAVEWLPLSIFALFPDDQWVSEIPLFGMAYAANNLGFIWTNIAAQPTITIGSKPGTTTYNQADTAVALSLFPVYIQPMEFEPLVMHQLRYDKMATNWSQAMAKASAQVQDHLLYVLASTVPVASQLYTTGASFPINAVTDLDAFYQAWFSFTGNLNKPTLNDIIRLEQLYNKQNFDLNANRPIVVLGTTAESYLNQDAAVQNKLTEWKVISPGRIAEFRSTTIYKRSRVAVWDQAQSLILDPSGSIPNTAVDANVSLIPNQVGRGIGLIDVFFIQSPTTYSYIMSADWREGISPLRANFDGTALLNYGTPVQP